MQHHRFRAEMSPRRGILYQVLPGDTGSLDELGSHTPQGDTDSLDELGSHTPQGDTDSLDELGSHKLCSWRVICD